MGRVKNTVGNATMKCVKAACVMTGWTIGATTWSLRAATGLTTRAVRVVTRILPGKSTSKNKSISKYTSTLPSTGVLAGISKRKRSLESEEVVEQPQKKKVSFLGKSLLKSVRPFGKKTFERLSFKAKSRHIKEEPVPLRMQEVEAGFYENSLFKQAMRDISDEQPSKRYNAVMTLANVAAKIGTEAVIQPLVNAMKDQNGNVRSQACKVLVDLEVASAVNEMTLLLKDNNPRARLEALRGIYKLSTDTSSILCHLIDAAREQHREVRKRAATYLGWIENDEAISILIDLLGDKESIVRKTAVLSLGELRDRKAIIPLINLLDDKNGDVREVAVYTLRILTGQNFGYDPKFEIEERKTGIEKWNKWWGTNRLAFTIYKKEFVVAEVPTIEELKKSEEEERAEKEAAEKEEEERAEKEVREQAEKEAAEKAKEVREQAEKEAAEKKFEETKKEAIAKKETEAKSPEEKKQKEKPTTLSMGAKISKLKKVDREKLKKKLGARLESIRGKLEGGKTGEESRDEELDSLKAKMKDLEQILLLKEKKKTK